MSNIDNDRDDNLNVNHYEHKNNTNNIVKQTKKTKGFLRSSYLDLQNIITQNIDYKI